LAYTKKAIPWRYFSKVTLYTLFLLLLQSYWVSRLSYPELRIDLLLPLMFGIAVEWSPVLSIVWASVWGFVADALSGRFWGFHVGSYVVAICLVNITAERFEFHNPLYQMLFVGACALGQSIALGLFLLVEAPEQIAMPSIYVSLLLRSVVTMIVAPLITYPVWNIRESNL
jgi:rod shape-determining protein MreD